MLLSIEDQMFFPRSGYMRVHHRPDSYNKFGPSFAAIPLKKYQPHPHPRITVRRLPPLNRGKQQQDHINFSSPPISLVQPRVSLSGDMYFFSGSNLDPLALRHVPPTPPVVGLSPVPPVSVEQLFSTYDALDTKLADLRFDLALAGQAMQKVEVLNDVNQLIQKLVEITVKELLQIDSVEEIPTVESIVERFDSMIENIESLLRQCEKAPGLYGDDLAIVKALVNSCETFLRDSSLITSFFPKPEDWITEPFLRQRVAALPQTVFVEKENRGYWVERGYKELAENVLRFYEHLFQTETLTRSWNGRRYVLKGTRLTPRNIQVPKSISLFEHLLGWTIYILNDYIVIDIGPSHAPVL